MAEPRHVFPPAEGLWRIGRGDDPLRLPPRGAINLGDTRAGNRFDSLTGQYSVLYFGSNLEACFGETLARYRPDPRLAFIQDEWDERGFMRVGSVPADWRSRRTAVRISIDTGLPFLDVEDAGTLAVLRRALVPSIMLMGYDDLDHGLLRGPDRRVTRHVSQWAWHQEDEHGAPMFAGIRYMSRTNNSWECWAVFDDIEVSELERQPILPGTDGMAAVADLYDLTIH